MKKYSIILLLLVLSSCYFMDPYTTGTASDEGFDGTEFRRVSKELMDKVKANGINPGALQYYNSDQIVLRRKYDFGERMEADQGDLLLDSGKCQEFIVIPARTPGVCTMHGDDRLIVSFEEGTQLTFGEDKENEIDLYHMYAQGWSETEQVPYCYYRDDKVKYFIEPESGYANLLVRVGNIQCIEDEFFVPGILVEN